MTTLKINGLIMFQKKINFDVKNLMASSTLLNYK
jgi:hypothetical protein